MRTLALFGVLAGALVVLGAGCLSSPLALTPAPEVSSQPQSITTPLPESMPQWTFQGELPAERIAQKQARITTDAGEIVMKLFNETAPITVSNFVYLAEGQYYDGLTFHRREEGFVLQGGDPNGNGTGGPGYTFDDEVHDDYTYVRGIVAMANAGIRNGKGTNGSQFFIMLADAPLPKNYSIFGEVTSGMEVVDALARGAVMRTVVIEPQEE